MYDKCQSPDNLSLRINEGWICESLLYIIIEQFGCYAFHVICHKADNIMTKSVTKLMMLFISLEERCHQFLLLLSRNCYFPSLVKSQLKLLLSAIPHWTLEQIQRKAVGLPTRVVCMCVCATSSVVQCVYMPSGHEHFSFPFYVSHGWGWLYNPWPATSQAVRSWILSWFTSLLYILSLSSLFILSARLWQSLASFQWSLVYYDKAATWFLVESIIIYQFCQNYMST